MVKELKTLEEWKEAMDGSLSKPLLIFKHSTTCPVSSWAYQEFNRFATDEGQVDLALVLVRESRAVSNAIAEMTGVIHESPQIILLSGGKVMWHASHGAITEGAIREAVKNQGAKRGPWLRKKE